MSKNMLKLTPEEKAKKEAFVTAIKGAKETLDNVLSEAQAFCTGVAARLRGVAEDRPEEWQESSAADAVEQMAEDYDGVDFEGSWGEEYTHGEDLGFVETLENLPEEPDFS